VALGDFPRDPNVKAEFGKAAPDGHMRRCQAKRRNGQCKYWALRDDHYCKWHSLSRTKKKKDSMVSSPRNKYVRESRPKLKKLLQKYEDTPADEKMKLLDELDMARLMVERSVKIYEATVVDPDPEKKHEITPELVAASTRMLRDALDQVQRLAGAQSKIVALAADTLSMAQFADVMDKIVDRIGFFLEDQPDLCKAVLDDVLSIEPVQKNERRLSITIE